MFAGFEFSDVEPSALVQRQGGPCAVIAPVQAFLLKTIIMETHGHSLGDVSERFTTTTKQIENIGKRNYRARGKDFHFVR